MYTASAERYGSMTYRRCGKSGLKLPVISLGLWHNFDETQSFEHCLDLLHTAFDCGITHFDLANNYGPPPGNAEVVFGKAMKDSLMPYRDEMIVSTKAGYFMWDGPYGDWGSRKYVLASLDQSLKRMGLDYVDIFYSHRPDPETPLEETMGALDTAVRQGKALYVGISSYTPKQTREAAAILKRMGTPCVIHQPCYNMLNRWVENGLLNATDDNGMGMIAFCPLAQGLLTGRYLNDIPADSRMGRGIVTRSLPKDKITPELRHQLTALNEIARKRGQSLAQLALTWTLRDSRMTSALIGASRPEQIRENVQVAQAAPLSLEELTAIDGILKA